MDDLFRALALTYSPAQYRQLTLSTFSLDLYTAAILRLSNAVSISNVQRLQQEDPLH